MNEEQLVVVSKRSTFTNASCPRSHHMTRTGTRWVALCVIRGYLALFRSSRSRLILQCLLTGLSVSVLQYFVKKLNVIYSCQRLTDFALRTPIWQRFTKVSCLRSYHRERTGSRSIPEVQPCRARIVLGWLTAWKYLVLQTFFFFFLITPLNCFGCFKTLALFCQGSVKIKLSLLSVHCYTTFMLSSK